MRSSSGRAPAAEVPVIEQVLDVSGLGAALPPTIQRIAGSCRKRSASLTSSYPARRPNTDCRSKPTSAWRPFLPVRASASISPAITLNPKSVVEFAVGQQPGIRGDNGAAKLQRQAAIQIEPNSIQY
jgi:hypothetical protein